MKLSVNVQLATLIIKDTFGDGMSDVCGLLMRRHKSSWRTICSETKLQTKQVCITTIIIYHHYLFVCVN